MTKQLRKHPVTPNFKILYDEPHESDCFRSLHAVLRGADRQSVTEVAQRTSVRAGLAYHRPDIVLLADDRPISVVEETAEVLNGRNLGRTSDAMDASLERFPSHQISYKESD